MIGLIFGALAGAAAAPVLRAAATRYAVPAGAPLAVCAQCGRAAWWLPPTGRCPSCRAGRGPAPLLVELAAVGAGMAVGAAAAWPVGPALGWVALFAVVLAFVDAAVHRLPDALTLPLGVGTALLLALGGFDRPGVLLRCLAAGVVLGLLYGVLAVLGPMGLGDAKLALTLGALLAWYGWRAVFDGAFAGFLLAALWGLLLLVTGRAKAKDPLPFGPCMLLGALVAVLAVR
ncbi:leader peptidase (prepilin peptidase)/N-methyltransferase [Kitasatospora sp. GAS204A]|uniref:prepilin peptidase n=1 Tax=unclassified Kitasatospora TaxID=2633591 RepID=UPI0024745F42|nr:prepilin peptidase [Kitasatospora sp. GAS204B]MDH6116610.1 leader peptidase (prepilin peptidase)/N-methyltransferase [Kitasatospora sp. GAS204B]